MTATKTSSGTSPVLVLSYNICFQAMTNHSSGSARNLGAKCVYHHGSKLTICGSNMAHMIEAIPASLQVSSFDFIGFQEASHWDRLPVEAPSTLGKMTCVHSREGRSDMASYFDGNKYKLVKKFTGEFKTDRPFQILVFKHTFDNSGTIFLNAHCPHGYTFAQMQTHHSNAVQGKLTDEEKKYRIIAVGDYNETSWSWKNKDMDDKQWQPFATDIISTTISLKKPIISCSMDGKWSNAIMGDYGMRGGDYVFDSKNPAVLQIPPKYPYDAYLSDHLPVVALLS